MKKVCVILALLVVSILVATCTSQAADLQAGWYANVYMVYVFTYDVVGQPVIGSNGWFEIAPGQYGPFTVSDGPYGLQGWREVSVATDSYGLEPDSSLVLPVSFGMSFEQPIAYLYFSWATNYDSGNMLLEFWQQKADQSSELVWAQRLSGENIGETQVFQDSYLEGSYFFRVHVVPEPSGIAMLLGGSGFFLGLVRRRR